MRYNDSGGVLPLDHILTLRDIKQKSAGQYACSALNSEGETYSAPFNLSVQCKYTNFHSYKTVRRIFLKILDAHFDYIYDCKENLQ